MKETRRQFLKTTTLAASAVTILPRHVLGGAGRKAPSEKLNIAGVGVGGMGKNNLRACAGENIVALCDVDANYAAKVFAAYPQAKVYRDFRQMLDQQKDIEAVIVATPDHTHAPIAMAAMRAGKHVYVQKPLTHSVFEARALTEAAREYKVVTQMGNQGHSGDGTRLVCEWIARGRHRRGAGGPRLDQSAGLAARRGSRAAQGNAARARRVGLGPVARPGAARPYHPCYLPGTWRAWCDFGTGALGDMGCHLLDAPFWALEPQIPRQRGSHSSRPTGTPNGKRPSRATRITPARASSATSSPPAATRLPST